MFIWSKIIDQREKGEPVAVEMKVITPGKIVPHKCCLASLSISMTKDFDTDVLFNYRRHTFLSTFCNVY